MAVAPEHLLAVMELMEQEDAEYEELLMAMARLAVLEVQEMEEGLGLDGVGGESWEYVTVIINEYHVMGDPCFRMHFRMSRMVFEALTAAIRHHLTANGRLQRERTPFIDIVLMFVWLMATPDTFRSVALRFGVRPATLHYFYTYLIEALREMASQYISWPDAEERGHIKNTFQQATGFPGIVGCIDGTHIFVTAPVQDPAPYRNRHHSYSLNVQAVVDSTLLVRDLHVGEPGSMHDARVFRRSSLHDDLVHGRDRLDADEHLVGDGAYILTDFMMIPFPNNGHLNDHQLNFNRKLSQSRVRVENAFGRAKGKWRRMKFLHARNAAYVVDHITASFVLHNFTIRHGEPVVEEGYLGRPIADNEVLGNEMFEGNNADVDELLHHAEARGIEKRELILNNLPN